MSGQGWDGTKGALQNPSGESRFPLRGQDSKGGTGACRKYSRIIPQPPQEKEKKPYHDTPTHITPHPTATPQHALSAHHAQVKRGREEGEK